MEQNWLQDFIALHETGNFSKASELRNITQPAFSRRIRSLEHWIGTPLFERTSKGVLPTAAGREFALGANDLVRRIATLRRKSREAADAGAVTLRFAATHALSFTFFPKWIRAIEQRGAIGPIQLISDSMQACEELMLYGEVQFLLCHQNIDHPSQFTAGQFDTAVVGSDVLAPFAAPDRDGKPMWHLGDEGPFPFLQYSKESGLGRIFRRHPIGNDTRLDPIFTSHLAAVLMSMARSGGGIAWLPESLARTDIEEGRLVSAGPAENAISLDITVIRPADKQGKTAETFWSGLRELGKQT